MPDEEPAYAVLLAASVHLPFREPSTETRRGRFIMVVAQTIVVCDSIANPGRQAHGSRRSLG